MYYSKLGQCLMWLSLPNYMKANLNVCDNDIYTCTYGICIREDNSTASVNWYNYHMSEYILFLK
jgi:hypothetical protein